MIVRRATHFLASSSISRPVKLHQFWAENCLAVQHAPPQFWPQKWRLTLTYWKRHQTVLHLESNRPRFGFLQSFAVQIQNDMKRTFATFCWETPHFFAILFSKPQRVRMFSCRFPKQISPLNPSSPAAGGVCEYFHVGVAGSRMRHSRLLRTSRCKG